MPPPITPASSASIRSGDLVNQSVTTTGLIGALLSPWIGGVLKFITEHSAGYLSFGDGYDTQLTMAIVVIAMAVQGRWHMRSIRKVDAPADDSTAPIV